MTAAFYPVTTSELCAAALAEWMGCATTAHGFTYMASADVGGDDSIAVGHYRTVHKLRSGGMGDVYLAEDQVLPRVVALKLLPQDRSGDDALQHRFMREARAASSLSHPNIARIYEAGEDSGRVFIAMEFVEGQTLGDRIAREAVGVEEIVRIATQLTDAVQEAHARGVIHRDLKPSNVMLTTRGDVKVLDFGLAKFHDDSLAPTDDTPWKSETGVVLGTVPYMSPEQALGRTIDPRSDIFSIGVILYELVTRRLPFAGATTADTLFRIVNDTPEPMARFNYDLHPELERIIRKCLEKSADRRYQSAAELLVDLRNLERDRLLARDPHGARLIGGSLNQKRTLIWAVALLVAVFAAALLSRRTPAPAAPAPARIASIAVLPFENAAGAGASDIADGVPDVVIGELARVRGLRVVARSTSFSHRGTMSVIETGQKLSADAVLTGRVTGNGERILVTTELVSVRDGSRIGGGRFERSSSDITTLAAAISNGVLSDLGVRGGGGVRPRNAVDGEAYRLYLRGREQWNTRSPEGLQQALDLFRQSIEIDAQFAPAYAGLADTYSLLDRYAHVPNNESRSRAIAAAQHAVELDPDLPEAYASLASVRETYSWDWKGAGEAYRRAIELSPSYATAHHWYGLLLARLGKLEDGRREIAIARDLDPLSAPICAALASVGLFAGDYRGSSRDARAALNLNPQYHQARLQLAQSLALGGQPEEALRELAPIASLPEARALDAYIRARQGDRDPAERLLQAVEPTAAAKEHAYALAVVRMGLGDHDRAIEWLRTAADVRSVWVVYVAVDPFFEPVRKSPEFIDLLRRLGLDDV